jgi:hypothetical protein
LSTAPCPGQSQQQVTGEVNFPLEHHVSRRHACGLMCRCSVGQQEDWQPLIPIPLVCLHHLLQMSPTVFT